VAITVGRERRAGATGRRARLEDIGEYVAWLRLPPAGRAGAVALLPSADGYVSASTVNRKLTAFYQHQARHGADVGELLTTWQTILDACGHLRDRFLFALLYDSGVRVGEALGLRHEDIAAAERQVSVVPRANANRARCKSRGSARSRSARS
jgi:integrase/recombinase XerD